MSSTEIIQSKAAENSHISVENKLELETHHSDTIYCDMISPDEWKSSLPLVYHQDDICLMGNSPTSPSNSIEDLVLELESSQDMGSPFSEYQESLLHKMSSPKSDGLLCIIPDSKDMLCDDILENEKVAKEADQTQEKSESLVASESEVRPVNSEICRLTEPEEGTNELEIQSTVQQETEQQEPKNQQVLDFFSTKKSTSAVSNNVPAPVKESSTSTAPLVTHKRKRVACVISPQKGKKSSSIQHLTNQLAEVIHCNKQDDVNILQKATSTISTLRRQACDLMSTYSQLKFQNDELIQKQNLLQSGQHMDEIFETQSKCPLTIEVLIPSAGSRKAFDSAPLYHHIPIEDGQIPTISGGELQFYDDITVEPYEEQYDAQMNFNPAFKAPKTHECKNMKLPCELGCICSSLTTGKLPVQHCKSPICMLEPECIRPDDPSHIPSPVNTIINRRNSCDVDEVNLIDSIPTSSAAVSVNGHSKTLVSPFKRNVIKTYGRASARKAAKRVNKSSTHLDAKQVFDDEKLKQTCFVRLIKLDTTTLEKKSITSHDAKLKSNCYVRLNRLPIKQDQSVFCMIHRVYRCTCLASSIAG